MYGGVGGGSREASPYPDWEKKRPQLQMLGWGRHSNAPGL